MIYVLVDRKPVECISHVHSDMDTTNQLSSQPRNCLQGLQLVFCVQSFFIEEQEEISFIEGLKLDKN